MPQSIQFNAASEFLTLSPEQLIEIAISAAQHVQVYFAKEAEVLAARQLGEIKTRE